MRALRFAPSSARVAALRFDPSPAQMSAARVSAARALRFVSPSASPSASSASSASFTRSTSRSSSCYVPAEIRAFRRAARALKISESSSSIFEHVINLIKQMMICTNMKFADLRVKLSKHFRHMAKIIRQI